MSATQPDSNLAEVSVSELSGRIKRTVEDAFGYVRVRGEVSGYRGPHSSGHCYFALKDEKAKIDAIIWRGTFARLAIRPEEGLEVIATGKVTTYAGRSSYQIVIEHLEPAGEGALLALLKERERRLDAEGLFDPARKKRLPMLPRRIGVITSPTGAVIRDILHRIADRCPVHVLVWPVRVQGEGSGAEVAGAIAGFNALGPGDAVPRPDVLIVARGGGSLEDLWGFNDEEVVRAAADSAIPLISAVGHETDWTLLDHAADLRAPTPTAAAELCVPVRRELDIRVSDLASRRGRAMLRGFAERRARAEAASGRLPRRAELFAVPRQRLDAATSGLERCAGRVLHAGREAYTRCATRLSPHSLRIGIAARRGAVGETSRRGSTALRHRLGRAEARLEAMSARLSPRPIRERGRADRRRLDELGSRGGSALARAVVERRRRLDACVKLYASLNPTNVLARGFALVRDGTGAILRSADAARQAGQVRVTFAQGEAEARIGDADPSRTGKPARTGQPGGQGRDRSKGPVHGQGSLF